MNYLRNIKNICDIIQKQTDSVQLSQSIEKLYSVLRNIYSSKVELTREDEVIIKQNIQEAINVLIEKGVIKKDEVTKPSSILDNINVEEQNVKISSKLLNVGIASLLLSCASLFANIVKQNEGIKSMNNTSTQLESNNSEKIAASITAAILQKLEGSVKGNVYDSNGNIIAKNVHVVYDDHKGNKKATPWDGKIPLQQFIKKCDGTPTIGYGVTDLSVVSKGYLTDVQAKQYLSKQIMKRISQNKKICGNKVIQSLSYAQQGCLFALWYNLGSAKSTPKCNKYLQYAFNPSLDKSSHGKLNRNDYLKLAANQFLDCNKVGNKQVKGLTNRVNFLHDLFIVGLA